MEAKDARDCKIEYMKELQRQSLETVSTDAKILNKILANRIK